MNLEISYLYRDAANNKRHESVVISVRKDITPARLEEALRQHFSSDQLWPDILHFRPEALGWPTGYFQNSYDHADDLDLHEVEEIALTDKSATSSFPMNLQVAASRLVM